MDDITLQKIMGSLNQTFYANLVFQNVRIDDIPLPNTMGPSDADGNFLTTDIPLPPSMMQPKAGILKKPSVL